MQLELFFWPPVDEPVIAPMPVAHRFSEIEEDNFFLFEAQSADNWGNVESLQKIRLALRKEATSSLHGEEAHLLPVALKKLTARISELQSCH